MPVEFGEGLQIYSLSFIKSTQTLFTLCFSDITLDVNHLSVQWSYPQILIKCGKKNNNCFLNEHCSVCTTTFSRTTCFSVMLFAVSRCCMLSIPQRRRKIKNKREVFTFHQFCEIFIWNQSTCFKRETEKWTISM